MLILPEAKEIFRILPNMSPYPVLVSFKSMHHCRLTEPALRQRRNGINSCVRNYCRALRRQRVHQVKEIRTAAASRPGLFGKKVE